jgi:hypothetical protein
VLLTTRWSAPWPVSCNARYLPIGRWWHRVAFLHRIRLVTAGRRLGFAERPHTSRETHAEEARECNQLLSAAPCSAATFGKKESGVSEATPDAHIDRRSGIRGAVTEAVVDGRLLVGWPLAKRILMLVSNRPVLLPIFSAASYVDCNSRSRSQPVVRRLPDDARKLFCTPVVELAAFSLSCTCK